MTSIAYHLEELEIARNVDDPRNVLPVVEPSDEVILDIGCGIGQTFIALDCLDRRCIGVDIDADAIEYGEANFPGIQFHLADAQQVPVGDGSVDLVMTRVALPYTNIPLVIREMKRLLKPDGRVWITIHSLKMARGFLWNAIRHRDWKDIIHKIYVILNGFLFKFTQRVCPFITGAYESWQDSKAFSKCLQRHGFQVSASEQNGILVIEGTLTQADEPGRPASANASSRQKQLG